MGFSALQIILVFVWVFIVAIDQFDFLESLYQPIVSGAVIGAILGDLAGFVPKPLMKEWPAFSREENSQAGMV